jgi:hypothetical protein
MLHMHADRIAEVLNSLSTFARRVMASGEPHLKTWWLSPEISIQQAHWLKLCHRVMGFLWLLGFGSVNEPEALAWPTFLISQPESCGSKLCLAGKQALEIFRGFVQADCEHLSLHQLYSFEVTP